MALRRPALPALVVALTIVGTASVGTASAGTGRAGTSTDGAVVVEAAFPASMTALADGGLRYGERLTGAVREITADGRLEPQPVASVSVSTAGQRGLLGLAVDGTGRTFAAWTRPDRRIVVGQVAPGEKRIVWRGPRSSRLANGGRLAIAPDGGLVVGIGDLQDREKVDDPDAPNGKLLRLDPDGPADQDPEVISKGWNNPFAFTYTPSGALWVADNTGKTGSERLARGDRSGRPTHVTALRGTRAPSGLAALDDDRLLLCGFVSRRLELFKVDDGDVTRVRPAFARDCSIGVITMADGSLAYANETGITFVPSPEP